jgi:hypothetical protein
MATDAQVVVDLIQEMLPALASVSDAALLPHATKNLTQWSASAFGDMYFYAVAYASAHDYQLFADAVSFGASAAGPVQSKKAGEVSLTFVGSSLNMTDPKAYYARTVYGQMFLQIMNQRAAAHATVFGPCGE